MLVPMPKPSIGARWRANAVSESSSSSPLAKIVTSCKPPASRMVRTVRDSATRSPEFAANGANGYARVLEFRRQRHDLPRRRFGVIGIDQQHQIVRSRLRECGEGRDLIVERLYEECAMVP